MKFSFGAELLGEVGGKVAGYEGFYSCKGPKQVVKDLLEHVKVY